MRRCLRILSAAVVAWIASPQALCAQTVDYPLADGWSGPGFYLQPLKILACWAIFAMWVYTTDWVSDDAQERKLNHNRWNPLIVGSFLGTFVLTWLIPFFWVDLVLLLAAYITPLSIYIVQRNKLAPPSERVLTRDHLRYWFAQKARFFGMKVQSEAADPHESGPPIVLTSRGGATERDNNIRLLSARQAPGFRDARQIIADGLEQRADAMMLDYAQQAVGTRYLVDGVWLDGEAHDRESADPALETLKILCGLNPQNRQGRQEGGFSVDYRGSGKLEKISATLTTQGTQTGERAVIQFERKKSPFGSLEELGMRPKMQEQYLEALGQHSGLVLLAAPPANGLRTSMALTLRGLDRFMREFVSVEDESNRYEPVENVPVMAYKPEEKNNLTRFLDDVFHREPNVVVIRDLVDAKMLEQMFEQINENSRMFMSTVRAKDTTDALMRVLALKVPPAELAKSISAVLCQRLIRKLCDSCKEAYAPPAEVLKQLQIPEGRVQALYRPGQPHPEDPKYEPCAKCQGVGYYGRTAIFELLVLDDSVRKVLATNPKPEAVRLASRKAGMRTLQEEGIVLVGRGITSLPELMRVMKQ